MRIHEIHDTVEARRFLAQGFWLQRADLPRAETVGPALRWTMELASGGEPIPPIGFVADVGHLVFGQGHNLQTGRGMPEIPGWPAGLARSFEDLVLGKLDADGTMVRAADALARYRGRDRDRGLAFLLEQLRRRARFGGVLLNPAVIKAAMELLPEEFLNSGWESLAGEGLMPLLPALYSDLIAAVRDAPEALGPEDVFELEHGTALAAFSQRVALRQVVQSAAELASEISQDKPRMISRRHEVATRILDEDTYPVGGFSSISTRGSIESLLHSQLAYMEPTERPDLFDIKYVRDELLYYARDENQFLRRRRTFLIVLDPSLTLARVKDVELPRQRIILALGLLVALVQRLTEWLCEEAIVFEFLFVRIGDANPLAPEQALVEMILREAIANGTVRAEGVAAEELTTRGRSRARRSLCHALIVATAERTLAAEGVAVASLRLDGPRPVLDTGEESATPAEEGEAPVCWRLVLEQLLRAWA